MHLLLALGLLAGPGIERGSVDYRPGPSEARVPELFRLRAETFAFEIEERRQTAHYRVSAVRFPSPVVSGDEANDTVHAEYFRPTGGPAGARRPAVVVLHILGADFALSRYLAARLAEEGVAALFVKLPYYGERRPADLKEPKRFLSTDLERSTLAMRQGICDVRRAAAWLASRPEVDPERLGVTGISLGGIVSSIAAAVDPTLNRAALLLAGGDLAEILWTMPEAARYREMWIQAGRTKDDLATLTRPFDPLTYAEGLRGKHVMMIAGAVDEVIPPASAKALWEKAGRPPIRWFDCGHYSAAAYLLPAIRETVAFFADRPAP